MTPVSPSSSPALGIAAKFAERGGADMIGLFNSSYLGLGRVEATSLMPYGNANDIVMSLGDRIFPVVQNTPILGGIIGTVVIAMFLPIFNMGSLAS